MCIRDRSVAVALIVVHFGHRTINRQLGEVGATEPDQLGVCLLYTSDAADERSSVDLGGRRIIKKKNRVHNQKNKIQKERTIEDNVAVEWIR